MEVIRALSRRRICQYKNLSLRFGLHKWYSKCADMHMKGGLPVLTIELPSRNEKCQFVLKPLGNTVDDVIRFIKTEDRGIDRALFYTTDGSRIAGATSIADLLQNDFKLAINDQTHIISPPLITPPDRETIMSFGDVKSTVHQLYSILNVREHQLSKEKLLKQELEAVNMELEPLEREVLLLQNSSRFRANVFVWSGLAYMSLQFGLLARLTWWEYSWDIMEPVTYFVGYGTSIAFFAYYCLTRQDFLMPDVYNRNFLITFYKGVKKHSFDVARYNELNSARTRLERDIRRLQDPLDLQLPILPVEEIDQSRGKGDKLLATEYPKNTAKEI